MLTVSEKIDQVIREVHASRIKAVVALAGGGSRALSELLTRPGASRTVLEAIVPYSEKAAIRWLGGRPDQFCSAPTARAMAMAAFNRASQYEDGDHIAGLACAASLATDRPKKGRHRVHVAAQSVPATFVHSLTFAKGKRDRSSEEDIVAAMLLNVAAAACQVDARIDLDLHEGEQIDTECVEAPSSWQDLLMGRAEAIRTTADNDAGRASRERAIFPGAFNPLHVGHLQMIETAEDILRMPIEPEMSITNVDKPPLDYFEIRRRLEQFEKPDQAIWLTRAATFEQKSQIFPRTTFVVGADTMRRIVAPRYYGGDPAAMKASIERICARGCQFLVFGRDLGGTGFVRVSDLDLPDSLRNICREVPETRFREDVSSTEIRKTWNQ